MQFLRKVGLVLRHRELIVKLYKTLNRNEIVKGAQLLHRRMCEVAFYRAMHYSAKRVIAIACPSVRLSVSNVGGSGPHRLDL